MPKVASKGNMEEFFACLAADSTFMSALQTNALSAQEDHCIMRSKAKDLGLKGDTLPYAKLAEAIPNFKIIYCNHVDSDKHKRGTILVDVGNEDLLADLTAPSLAVPPPGEDWYVVTPQKSAIFVNTEGKIELVVICGACGIHPDILEYVNSVISEAVQDHKGVCKDGAILGILALTWNLLTKTLPEEVVAPTRAAIADAGLPPMASKGDISEHGYYLDLPCG
ncbi:hypothetical protein EDC04DRAFT_2615040 [Pisolithus marmoratus]|nr:hypothetical protein EDC04DRAFT_2615040 [Pisolithus marmoratus]